MADDKGLPAYDATAVEVFRIRNTEEQNVEDLEAELGRLFFRDIAVFHVSLKGLTDRDRRATVYVLIGHVRAALTKLEAAAEFITQGECP